MARHVPTYHLYGENSGKEPDFWLHCETIKSRSSLHRWEIRLHRHESFFQILYVEAGSGDATLDSKVHPLDPPVVVTIPPGVDHGFRFSRDIEGLVITILTSHLGHSSSERSRFGDWLAAARVTRLDPQNDEAAFAILTLRRLGEEFEHRRSGRNELLAAYVTQALRLTARISHEGDTSQLPAEGGERRMEVLSGLIQQHFRAHKSASFYAAELGMSLTHLNRITRAMTGHTVHDLLCAKLIEEAKRELLFSIASAGEIGLRLGFADPAYFSRFFLKESGLTPRAWRMKERMRLDMATGGSIAMKAVDVRRSTDDFQRNF